MTSTPRPATPQVQRRAAVNGEVSAADTRRRGPHGDLAVRTHHCGENTVGDDLEDAHAPAALAADGDVDGEDSREEAMDRARDALLGRE